MDLATADISTGDDLIAHPVDEHGKEYVLENWESKIEPASVVLDLPAKEELPFDDGK